MKPVSDNGGEFKSRRFESFCGEVGILTQVYTVPDTPQLNGIAERFNQTLFTKVRAMMLTATFQLVGSVTATNHLRCILEEFGTNSEISAKS